MIARSFALLIIWIALWGELNLANVITGVLVITALTMLFSGLRRREHKIRVLPAISFFFYMLRSIVASSWDIIVAVLFPTEQRRHSEIVWCALT